MHTNLNLTFAIMCLYNAILFIATCYFVYEYDASAWLFVVNILLSFAPKSDK